MGRSNGLVDEARSYMKSRVILTAAELDLVTELSREPTDAAGLASRLGLDRRALTRILDCLVAIGLFEKADGAYRVTDRGAPLAADHPETVLPMVLHLNHMWRNWSWLTECVRHGENPHRVPVEGDRDTLASFIQAMHVIGRELANEVVSAYDTSRFRRLLDIGGGSGIYTMALLQLNPDLRAVIFDMPDVIPLAKERLSEAGLLDRVELAPGDFYADELPGGCDLALLSAIVHQNSPGQNVDLCRKVHRALEPGGSLVIRDHVMDAERTRPVAGSLFALNMLVGTDAGDTYTLAEMTETLEEAGFEDVRFVREGGDRMDSLVEARKPR